MSELCIHLGKPWSAMRRPAIAACAGLNVRLAARRITQFLESRMANSCLTVAQFGLMTHVAAASDETLGALAARTGLDQSTLSRNLRGLETDGLVEIAVVNADMRRRSVWLTEAGARRLEAALPIWRGASFTSSSFADAVDRRPSINAVSSSRVRCEAGILVAMGCSFAGLAKARLLNQNQIRKGRTPLIFQQF
jgi:DNA-binding MarR family transcriptional regulator